MAEWAAGGTDSIPRRLGETAKQVYRADGGIPLGGLEWPGSSMLRPELQKCSIRAV